ncbi:hypothetical protein OESDEN_20461 [Oesophagostomum dentatum]|uniref:Mitochondrial carrier protein n=1 Tax=Oesophagostomum dentatum TaxID=61180 RepID=A0A0B1S4L0_OESDE|nr:hypothetical protein OESDEN_20461 [Oesophagostomum dentatum]
MREILPFHTPSENVDNFICAILTGCSVLCISNPIWVVKTRLCLQYETAAKRNYTGMVDCLVKLFKGEGVRGLYRVSPAIKVVFKRILLNPLQYLLARLF